MQYKLKNWQIVLLTLLVFIIISIFTFFLLKNNVKKLNLNNSSKIDISKIVTNFKENKKELNPLYESNNLKDIIILVYNEDSTYNSYLINKKTGETNTFLDYINNKDEFNNKLTELLNLKYPYFIVDALTNATQSYFVKDTEVTIYFSNYSIENYSEALSLTINYQEIKDYLKFTPNLTETYTNEDGFNYDQSKKTVAITFDDGPSRKYNPLILETLEKNKAHASFFMVGNMMASCESCVLNTYNSGNEIGSHTYNHLNIKTNSKTKVEESLTKTNDIYHKITGDDIKLLRPPYGSYNKNNLTNINLPFILWNLDTEDWRYRDVSHITEYIKNNVSDGSIILMHELYETSYEALEEILPWLYLNGYQVVSVSELASLKNRTLEVGSAYRSLK